MGKIHIITPTSVCTNKAKPFAGNNRIIQKLDWIGFQLTLEWISLDGGFAPLSMRCLVLVNHSTWSLHEIWNHI